MVIWSIISIINRFTWLYPLGYCAGEGQSEFNTLFPGDEGNVTLELYNLGASRNFTLEVTAADRDASSFNDTVTSFNFSVNPERVFVAENETTAIIITVIAPENATDGTGIMLTATASSDDGESDFVAFEVTVSTIPPPEDTENVSLTIYTASILLEFHKLPIIIIFFRVNFFVLYSQICCYLQNNNLQPPKIQPLSL